MKSQTLKENRDFRRLYNRGKCFTSPVLVTYAMKRKGTETRVGITSGKKIGNAVKRNRARRIIREAFSEYEGNLNSSYDFVFVARTRTTVVKTAEVSAAMKQHLKSLGAIE